MNVPQAPKGMTYFEFVADRIDAAKTVEPSRCGWGMMLSLATLGPIYSVVYTEVGIHPDGALARGTAPDPDIPTNVANAKWHEVPGVWWNTVERLSWTMVGKPATYGCQFRPVKVTNLPQENDQKNIKLDFLLGSIIKLVIGKNSLDKI